MTVGLARAHDWAFPLLDIDAHNAYNTVIKHEKTQTI